MNIFCQQECTANALARPRNAYEALDGPPYLNTGHRERADASVRCIIITNATFHQMHSFVFAFFYPPAARDRT